MQKARFETNAHPKNNILNFSNIHTKKIHFFKVSRMEKLMKCKGNKDPTYQTKKTPYFLQKTLYLATI